ncbi:SDR family oxidoreductase [Alphaproteobacteria bacterium]|nr:SDR family oxidoreductase [Alphaproteobacteria bacterium]
MEYASKKVLITGAAKRIGAVLAAELALDGWHVVIHCNNNRESADILCDKLQGNGATAEVLQADLSDPEACQQLIQDASQGQQLQALINNASLFVFDQITDFSAQTLQSHMAVNVTAPALLTAEFAKQLGKHDTGCVINILDSKLFGLNPDYFTYTLSKAALQNFGILAAQAYAPKIRVNAIAPGITLPSGGQTEDEFKQSHQRNLLGKGAETKDIVAAARLILSTDSMTGETIILDGGAHLQPLPRDVAFMKDN